MSKLYLLRLQIVFIPLQTLSHIVFIITNLEKHIDLLSMSPYIKIFDSTKFFVSRIHHLHVKIIKHIQASNEQ